VSADRGYVARAPHFRQTLPDPLERTQRTALLDQIGENWIRWSKGDARWDTLAALVSVLDRRDVDASAASWSASLSIVVEAVRDASQSRSPLTMQDAMMAIEELVAVCREPP
jgi:hypothetical protein